MYGYIYKTTDLLNNKIYVGQHKAKKFTDKYIGSGVKLRIRIREIGIHNFKVELLEECENKQKLCEREEFWIRHFQSCDSKIGYNIIDTAFDNIKQANKFYCRGLTTYYNVELKKEIRLHPGEEIPEGYVKGRLPFSEEHRKKLGRKGKRNGMYNKHRFGEKNPCFGKKWIYNPKTLEQRYINKDEILPEGFAYGNLTSRKRK